jgi:hypothetical protein
MTKTDELLEVGVLNLVWRQTVNVTTNSAANVVYESTNKNMETL